MHFYNPEVATMWMSCPLATILWGVILLLFEDLKTWEHDFFCFCFGVKSGFALDALLWNWFMHEVLNKGLFRVSIIDIIGQYVRFAGQSGALVIPFLCGLKSMIFITWRTSVLLVHEPDNLYQLQFMPHCLMSLFTRVKLCFFPPVTIHIWILDLFSRSEFTFC